MHSTNQARVIHASVEQVWDRIHDFHRLDWAPNVIEKVDKIGDLAGNTPGARRLLNGAFAETLLVLDEVNHQFKYSLDEGPSPISSNEVSNYIGTVKLTETEDGQTEIVWTSSWESKNADAVEFCQGIYVALMGDLDKSFH